MLILSLSLRQSEPRLPRSSLDAGAISALPLARASCYIRPMKKILAAVLLLMVFASPAFAMGNHHHHHAHPHHFHHPHV
jgi:predicted S18 family serine protease